MTSDPRTAPAMRSLADPDTWTGEPTYRPRRAYRCDFAIGERVSTMEDGRIVTGRIGRVSGPLVIVEDATVPMEGGDLRLRPLIRWRWRVERVHGPDPERVRAITEAREAV